MYCKNCGVVTQEGWQTCQSCGTLLSAQDSPENTVQPEQVQAAYMPPAFSPYEGAAVPPPSPMWAQQGQMPAYNPYAPPPFYPNAQQTMENPNDTPSGWWKFLGFYLGSSIPVAAIILYFLLKEDKPKTASAVGKLALIGFGTFFLLSILIIVAMFVFFAIMIEDPYSFYSEYQEPFFNAALSVVQLAA